MDDELIIPYWFYKEYCPKCVEYKNFEDKYIYVDNMCMRDFCGMGWTCYGCSSGSNYERKLIRVCEDERKHDKRSVKKCVECFRTFYDIKSITKCSNCIDREKFYACCPDKKLEYYGITKLRYLAILKNIPNAEKITTCRTLRERLKGKVSNTDFPIKVF